MTSFQDVSTAQLKQIIDLKEQIESLQETLSGLRGGDTPTTKRKMGRVGGKRKMSAATIEKMRVAQRARWAKKKNV